MVNIKTEVDAESVMKLLQKTSDDAPRMLARGLNNAGFELRKIWLSKINSDVENPVAFSRRVFVNKADSKNLEVEVLIPPLQSEYLRHIVDGEERSPGDYATYADEILSPVDVRLNRSGNFPQGPKRWLGKILDRENVFVATLPHSGFKGVWQRKGKQRKLTLLAKFTEEDQKYEKTLPLYEYFEQFSDQAMRMIDDQVDLLIR